MRLTARWAVTLVAAYALPALEARAAGALAVSSARAVFADRMAGGLLSALPSGTLRGSRTGRGSSSCCRGERRLRAEERAARAAVRVAASRVAARVEEKAAAARVVVVTVVVTVAVVTVAVGNGGGDGGGDGCGEGGEWVWMPSEGHQRFITSRDTLKRQWSQNTHRHSILGHSSSAERRERGREGESTQSSLQRVTVDADRWRGHALAFLCIQAHSDAFTHTRIQGECRPPKGLAQLQDACMLTRVGGAIGGHRSLSVEALDQRALIKTAVVREFPGCTPHLTPVLSVLGPAQAGGGTQEHQGESPMWSSMSQAFSTGIGDDGGDTFR